MYSSKQYSTIENNGKCTVQGSKIHSMMHNRLSAMCAMYCKLYAMYEWQLQCIVCDVLQCIAMYKRRLQCIVVNMIMKCGRGLDESVQETCLYARLNYEDI